jgi:hypothetical protein
MGERVVFRSSTGPNLAGIIEVPEKLARGWGVFAHGFTLGKDCPAAVRLCKQLAGGLSGAAQNTHAAPLLKPGVDVLIGFEFGAERYRYPANLPKVGATGGPQCHDLPVVPFDVAPPYVVADVGANPWQYGNPQLLINSDALKQLLYGPLDGPPRNTMQIGQPG